MVLGAALLNTQHYKVRIKGKMEQSREWSSALPYTLVYYLLKRETLGHPRLKSPTLLYSNLSVVIRTNPEETFFYGFLHMDTPDIANQ